ncbi:hypothetical protein [Phytohabitans aurantiacus]|uniref:Uncharacterized protein n=1 Tax=Phytohabitans aurantiacus TaxID=3016789 RepID=A0ABQ5R8B5_9ACTN|nr:hypothetical protein [Phytohabitans aurantiacus]GLI03002.1 hypothetical protein Pa4123_82800 [Phytohabitans aurantiacus]
MSAGPVVRVVRRRAGDLRSGAVIRLPERVLVPVPAETTADGQVRAWRWQVCQTVDLPGADRWRHVYGLLDVDGAAGDVEGMLAALGPPFTALRISAHEPGAAAVVTVLIVAVDAIDLVDVQQPDDDHPVGVAGPAADRYTLVGVWRDGRMLPVGIVPGEAEVRTVDADEPVWTLPVQTVTTDRRGDERG